MSRGWRSSAISGVSLALAGQWRENGSKRLVADETPPKARAGGAEPVAESPPRSEKYNLAYKFQPNQIVRYEVSNETEIKTQVKNETETVRNSSRSKRHYLVKAANEEGTEADLELSIDWVHMQASFENPDRGKTEPVEFQSDDPKKHPPQFEHVRATVGKPTAVIRFSDKGRPLEVLKGAVPAPAPPPAKKGPKGHASPPIADPTPGNLLSAVSRNSRSRRRDLERPLRHPVVRRHRQPVKITIQRNYKLAEVKDGRAVIELRTAVLTPVVEPGDRGTTDPAQIAGKPRFRYRAGDRPLAGIGSGQDGRRAVRAEQLDARQEQISRNAAGERNHRRRGEPKPARRRSSRVRAP